MGLNMPAKTVIFTKTTKWDGGEFRFLLSGEYTQMSGRAGRRGKDDRGVCIVMVRASSSALFRLALSGRSHGDATKCSVTPQCGDHFFFFAATKQIFRWRSRWMRLLPGK